MKKIIIISSLLLSGLAHSQNINIPLSSIQSNIDKKNEIDYFKAEALKTTAELNKNQLYLKYIIDELKSLSPNIDLQELERKTSTKEEIKNKKYIEKLEQQIVLYKEKYKDLITWDNKLQAKEKELSILENQLANQDLDVITQNAQLDNRIKKIAEKEFELDIKNKIILQNNTK